MSLAGGVTWLVFCVLLLQNRRWNSNLPRGGALLVSSSVEHDKVLLQAGLRAVILTSRCLIEPCGTGRSSLTHYCRADLRWVPAYPTVSLSGSLYMRWIVIVVVNILQTIIDCPPLDDIVHLSHCSAVAQGGEQVVLTWLGLIYCLMLAAWSHLFSIQSHPHRSSMYSYSCI